MRRKLWKLGLWIAASVAILIAGENIISPDFNRCLKQEGAENTAKSDQEKRSEIILIPSSQSICLLRSVDKHNGFFSLFAAIAVAFFTYTLWGSTNTLVAIERRREDNVRCRIGAGGQIVRFEEVVSGQNSTGFQIEVSNVGDGAAIVDFIRWGYGEFGNLPPVAAYSRQVPSGQAIFARSKQAVRHVPLPDATCIRPVIFFEFDYTDVSRGGRGRIGFVMEVYNPDFRALPVFIRDGIDPSYLKDIYPLP